MWVAAGWARTVGEACLKPKREARLVPRLLFRNAMQTVVCASSTQLPGAKTFVRQMPARQVGKLCSTSKRSTASRVYGYVRYELAELILPSGIPDPPGTPKPVKLSLLEHGQVQPRMVLPPAPPPVG